MLQPSLAKAFCFSLQPMTAYRPGLNANEGCNSCASLTGLVSCFMFYCKFYFTCDRSFRLPCCPAGSLYMFVVTSARRYCDPSCLFGGSFVCVFRNISETWERRRVIIINVAAVRQAFEQRVREHISGRGVRAHCPASIQAAAKGVREKCLQWLIMLLALRATGGGFRPTSECLLIWLYVHNVAKRSIWDQCKSIYIYIYWRPTDDWPLIWKISNGYISARGHPIHFMFGSTVGFSGSADRMALFPVWPNLIRM